MNAGTGLIEINADWYDWATRIVNANQNNASVTTRRIVTAEERELAKVDALIASGKAALV
jgi:hypothetical protein